MINQTDYFFFSLNLFSNTFYSGNRARAPNQQTPVKSASRIKYCCNYQKVCLHLFSWPCLQWMSSYFAYLTNLLFYECTITATAKGCYPESGEMYQITLEKLSLILTTEFFFLNLARCMIQMIILLTIQLIKWIVLVSVQLLS